MALVSGTSFFWWLWFQVPLLWGLWFQEPHIFKGSSGFRCLIFRLIRFQEPHIFAALVSGTSSFLAVGRPDTDCHTTVDVGRGAGSCNDGELKKYIYKFGLWAFSKHLEW